MDKRSDDSEELVASLLFKKAMAGDVGAIIFYLKSQAGWSERVSEDELDFAKFQVSVLQDAAKRIFELPSEALASEAKAIVSIALDQILLKARERGD